MNPELAQLEAFGKEILRRCMAEEEPADVRAWMAETMRRLGGAADSDALLAWEQSFDLTDTIVADYIQLANIPANERKVLDWPWSSWNHKIDPLDPGVLVNISAPDGQGKTIYGEMLVEYWAKRKHHPIYVHCELNKRLMMMRRLSRHASITASDIKAGKLTAEQRRKVTEVRAVLSTWEGGIDYLHTPGWTMERTVGQLQALHAEGKCDVVVVDYLEKFASSARQLRMFGTNGNMREADNVEMLKNFAEMVGIPVIMISQMKKDAKEAGNRRGGIDNLDRTSIKGAGEKTDKANIVILLHREKLDGSDENTRYSNNVHVAIDKNTMGGTGTFVQVMQPEYFRVADPLRV